MSTPEAPLAVERRTELDELLADRERVLVMVRTAGCAVCKSMSPILDNVARWKSVV